MTSARCSWLFLLLGLAEASVAQPFSVLKPPTSGDGATGDYFGVSLFADQEWLFAGAYADVLVSPETSLGVQAGAVTAYRLDGGGVPQPAQLLKAPELVENALFGEAMARAGEWLAVGAPRYSNFRGLEAGGVFLYRLIGGQWVHQQTLLPPVVGADGRFGDALWVGNGQLWVGAPNAGSGYVSVYQLGSPVQPLYTVNAPDGQQGFGEAIVPVGAQQMAIGAPGSQAVHLISGAAPTQFLVRFDGPAGFGSALAAVDNTLVIGAPVSGAGSVFRWTFESGQWVAQPAIVTADGQPGDQLGSSLLIDGNTLYIGAPGANRGTDFDVGAVYRAAVSGGPAVLIERTQPMQLVRSASLGMAMATQPGSGVVWVGAPLQPMTTQRGGVVQGYSTASLGSSSAVPLKTLDRGEGAELFRFGVSLAIDGPQAVVGAFLADTEAGSDAGYALVYRKLPSGIWQVDAKLLPDDAAVDQRFGSAVDIDGDTLVVGAYWTAVDGKPEQGAAYVYERRSGQWLQTARLVAADGLARHLFGSAVAIDGDVIAVAAIAAGGSGQVYVFQRSGSTWNQVDQLLPLVPTPSSFFGNGVAVDGDVIVVGAPGEDGTDAPEQGAAYVFRRGGSERWLLAQRLDSPVAQPGALYGFSVASDASEILVGAPGVDLSESEPAMGAAWLHPCAPVCAAGRRLEAPGLRAGDQYGWSVDLNARHVVIGANGVDSNSGTNAGAVFVHDRPKQTFVQRIDAPPDTGLGQFGRALGLDAQSQLLIGSPNRSGDNPGEGAAFVLSLATDLLSDGFED